MGSSVRFHSLVSQLHLGHHHLHNVPEDCLLRLLSVFCYMTKADAGNFPQVFG